MAKAPSESRIPMFGSRIPIPGKFRFLPNLSLRNPVSKPKLENPNVNSDKPPPESNRTMTIVNNQGKCNETVVLSSKKDIGNSTMTLATNNEQGNNCTVTLDAETAEATFILNSTTREMVTEQVETGVAEEDVGKKVCVGGVQFGVLRFVGKVQFSAGLWCGVELNEPVGKHDGCVKGVRYFSCQPGCGILAPASKVTLLADKDCDATYTAATLFANKESDDSGPFSLLAVESTLVNNRVSCNETQTIDATRIIQSEPIQQCEDRRKSYVISSSHSLSENLNQTCILNSSHSSATVCSTPCTDRLIKMEDLRLKPIPLDTNINNNLIIDTVSPIDTPALTKQNSFELDESLGILTPDQMVDFSFLMKTSNTLSIDDIKSIFKTPKKCDKIVVSRTPSSDNLGTVSNDGGGTVTSTSIVSMDSSNNESLMILSYDQMKDFTLLMNISKTPSSEDIKSMLSSKLSDKTISNSRTPSSENLGSMPNDGFKQPKNVIEVKDNKVEVSSLLKRPHTIDLNSEVPIKSSNLTAQAELSSPNAVENSMIDFSLGLIEEDILATANQFSSIIDTTTNLELPLDSISGKMNDFKSLSRSEQTPSPEDLPLDPIDPIKPVEMDITEQTILIPSIDGDTKTDVTKSTTTTKTNSFITSVTSITSLDTGYQGDGEMSRPASRGADHSPMAHKPNNHALVNLQWQRANIFRRQDPMTDSDFFTESDADVHEENAPKGDRKAQVIDGTLYGNNQAPGAQDIYIENPEEMESSGVFTDIDLNEKKGAEMKSPSETSTKTISENSQEIRIDDLDKTTENMNEITMIDMKEVAVSAPKSPTQSLSSVSSNRKNSRARTPQPKEENPNKKFKMPKRNVTSKVKTMMEQSKQNDIENQENRRLIKKGNKWDAVMNKISQGKEENKTKIRLKEVKSKISTGITNPLSSSNKRCETRKAEDLSSTKTKIRRIRCRGDSVETKPSSRTTSSVHSSLSDLSVGLSHNKQVTSHSTVNNNKYTKMRGGFRQ